VLRILLWVKGLRFTRAGSFLAARTACWTISGSRLRGLRAAPGFTLLVVLTLALGIGANTAIFSVVHGVLLEPAPVRDIDRLVMVWQTDRASGTTREPASIPDYVDFQRDAQTFEALAAFTGTDANVTPVGGDPFRVPALAVSHEFLPLLGVEPIAGRTFTAADDTPGAPPVAILGARVWEREFGRRGALAGATIRLDDVPHTVVGVLPPSADFGVLQVLSAAAYGRAFAERGRQDVQVWLPLRADPATAPRENHPIFVLGVSARGSAVGGPGRDDGDRGGPRSRPPAFEPIARGVRRAAGRRRAGPRQAGVLRARRRPSASSCSSPA
jgi:hypothetical protein